MRKPRVLRDNGVYHVVARANRKEFIFYSEELKADFLKVVARAKKKFSFRLINFCVMSNHFHFMIAPGKGENLSRIMQWILSVFAVRFNKRHGYAGHVWYDRFKSKIVENYHDFLHSFRYIAENPVQAGIVKRPWDYAFSGITYIRAKRFHLVEKPSLLLYLLEPELFEPRHQ